MKFIPYLFMFFLFFTSTLWGQEFPLCLYSVSNPADLKIIKKAGFSCIQSYQTDPAKLDLLAKEAKKRGLKVVFYPNKVLGTEYQQKAQQWPVLAWYLVDEPDIQHWSRERVIKAHQTTKEIFKNHPTALVISQGKTAVPFYDIPDVMMMDWYPVPHLPLTSFGDNVRFVKEGLAKTNMQDHPIWGVVQIFDWKNFKQYRPDNDRIGRFPTTEEIRFMSYHGILNGATGLFYFTFNHQGKPLPQSAPEYWARVQTVLKELAKFKQILEKGEATDTSVLVNPPLQMKSWQYKGHTYSIVLNASNTEQDLPDALTGRPFKILFGDTKAHKILPYQVLIIKK